MFWYFGIIEVRYETFFFSAWFDQCRFSRSSSSLSLLDYIFGKKAMYQLIWARVHRNIFVKNGKSTFFGRRDSRVNPWAEFPVSLSNHVTPWLPYRSTPQKALSNWKQLLQRSIQNLHFHLDVSGWRRKVPLLRNYCKSATPWPCKRRSFIVV